MVPMAASGCVRLLGDPTVSHTIMPTLRTCGYSTGIRLKRAIVEFMSIGMIVEMLALLDEQ